MDIRDKLILFKKQSETDFKDITERIKVFEREDKSYCITFNDGKTFHTKLENVYVLKIQGCINLANYKVVYQGNIKSDVTKIEVYIDELKNKIYKVFCNNGYHFICGIEDIDFYKFTDSDKNLISYWKSCACESKIDTIQKMMCHQYDCLIVNPNSVLYSYINKSNDTNKVEEGLICPFNFNNSQLKAIRSALQNKISIIKGPPGTGKTQTILNIICNLIIRKKTIAVISANNTAIENIEEKLKNNGYGILFASLGNGERKAEFFKNKSEISKVVEEDKINIPLKKLEFLSELFESENKSKSIKEQIEAIKLEQQYYEKFNREDIIGVEKYKFKNSQDLINYVTRYQEDTKEKQFTFFLWLKLILKYGFKKSLFKVENRNKVITSLEYKYYGLKLSELSKELEKLQKSLNDNKLEDLNSEFKTLSKQYLDSFINSNVSFETTFTQKDYKKRFSQFIKRYPIVTSTAISFMSSIESEYMFDYVIIDESSQVTIPSIIPLLNKCKNIVIVGDDKQLPPIEKYITTCDFDEVFNSNAHSLITSFMSLYPNTITTLLEHYRCSPSIIGFCNLKYYDNQLIPFTSENNGDNSLSICFTSNDNHMRKIHNGEHNGIYNQREIDSIDEILKDKNIVKIDHKDIGIISPYRLQIDKLQKLHQDIECDTIHKFQGREKDLIIFSSVLDNKASKNDFEFVDNANMINVTVSRAMKKFILIAHKEVFNEKGKEIHDLINYISYKTMNENLFESKCISIFDFLYKSKESERNKILAKSTSKSKYASERLLRTVIDEIINQIPYKQLYVQEQVKIKDLTMILNDFSDEEKTYIQNNCSVDFLIKDKVNQDIVGIIEVDGVEYHENNKEQQMKDALKDSILDKCGIRLLRLTTNGSDEKNKIKHMFDIYVNKFKLDK